MILKEQVENYRERYSDKLTLKDMSDFFGVSLQGMIKALERTGLRDSFDFKKNRGKFNGPRKRGYRLSEEHRKKLSDARKRRPPKLLRTQCECPECGRLFESIPESKNKSLNRDYCSNECKNKAHSRRMISNADERGRKLVRVVCFSCGKEMWKYPSVVTGEHAYCSRICQATRSKGKTYEEIFGEERATEIKEKIAIQTIEHNKNMPTVTKPHLLVRGEMLRQGIEGFLTSQRVSYFEIDELNPTLKIAVEVDGDYWHSSRERKIQDRRKDSFLRNRGYQVVRIRECDVYADLEREVQRVKEIYIDAKNK